MRSVDDLAIRAGNWFWYWCVRAISGLGNDALDRKCFGQDVRRKRHFERLQQTASSPDEVALLDGHTLLEIVDRWDAPEGMDGPFAAATQAFRSKLWTFLSTRDLAPHAYSDFIQQYVQQQGWTRIRANDFSLYLTFLGKAEPAIQPGVSVAFSAMLHKLVNQATPDALAVLIALFREAMHGVLLEQAIAIKSALGACSAWMCRRHGMPDDFQRLLGRLVDDRVLSNIWLTQADWRQHTDIARKSEMSSRERLGEFRAWVGWYMEHSIGRTGYGSYPIVPRSPRIDWLEGNRDELMVVYKRVSHLRHEHWVFHDSCIAGAHTYADDAEAEATRIIDLYAPPAGEPACFYDSRPALEIGNLPQAYDNKPLASTTLNRPELLGEVDIAFEIK